MVREYLILPLGALLALIAQIVVAPNIAIFSAMPNLMLAFVLVASIARPGTGVLIVAFALGLAYDLVGLGPMGAMSLLFVLVAFAASKVFQVLNNDTLFMPLFILAVSAFAVEIVYAFILLSFGATSNLIEAFLYRALPCALYDCVFALVSYPLAIRLLSRGDQRKDASYANPAPHASGVQVQATAPNLKRSRRMK